MAAYPFPSGVAFHDWLGSSDEEDHPLYLARGSTGGR